MSKKLRQGKRRKMVKFRMGELSAVDVPAQEGARALIIKRGGEKNMSSPLRGESWDDFFKRLQPFAKGEGALVLLTSTEDGHSHAVWVWPDNVGGETSYGKGPDDEMGHSHPWAMDALGNVTIGENDGHVHTVDVGVLARALMAAKRDRGAKVQDDGSLEPPQGSNSMPNDNDGKQKQELETQVADLTKRAERADAIVALSAEHRAHFDALEGEAQDQFLAKSADERDAILRAEAEADKVVYKAADGTEFRASDDPRIVAQAKRADEAHAKAEAAEKRAEDAELRKRVDDVLSHSPGTIEERMETLRAVEGIADQAQREASLKALKAGNEALKAGFERKGTGDGGDADLDDSSPEGQLHALVTKRMTEDKISEHEAYTKVLDTPEGRELYGQIEVRS